MKKLQILETKIEDLGLSLGAYNGLKRAGCETLGDILELGEENLLNIQNLGKKRVDEIASKIEETYGFELKLSINAVYKRLQKSNWQEYLENLPAIYYTRDDYIIICKAMAKYMQDKLSNALFDLRLDPENFEKSKQNILSAMTIFRKIVEEKQANYTENEDLGEKLAQKLLERNKHF